MKQSRTDAINAERLSHVLPEMAEIASKVIATMKASGWTLIVTQGFRTPSEQLALYKKGRIAIGNRWVVTDQKKVVTNLKFGNHNLGKAVDVAFVVNGHVTYGVPETAWEYYGHCVRLHGARWGGDWRSIHDGPHMEI